MIAVRYIGATALRDPYAGTGITFQPQTVYSLEDVDARAVLGYPALFQSAYATDSAVFLTPSGDTTGATDRAAVQAAVDAAASRVGVSRITLSSGQWWFNGAVTITSPVLIEGMGSSTGQGGVNLRNTLITNVSATAAATFAMNATAEAIWGGGIRDLSINGNGVNDGIVLRAVLPYGLTQATFSNLVIRNVRDGINAQGSVNAEVYQNEFRNIKITSCTRHGFYLDISAYNQLWNIETTGITGSAGWGFFIAGSATVVQGLMTEGCVNINANWGKVVGINVETIAAATPISPVAVNLNGTGLSVSGISLINVNPARCNYGIQTAASHMSIKDVLVSGSVGPSYVFAPQASSSGVLENVHSQLSHFTNEATGDALSTLARWRFVNCDGADGIVGGHENSAKQVTRLFALRGANFQSTADQAFTKFGGFTNYRITGITAVRRTGSYLTACAGGIYTGASKTGNALVAAGQSWIGLSGANKMADATLDAINNTDVQTLTPILSLTTANAQALTADVFIYGYIMDAV